MEENIDMARKINSEELLNERESGAIIWIACSVYTLLITYFYVFINKNEDLKITSKFLITLIILAIPRLFKNIYWFFARYKNYSLKLVRGITNCWTIYLIINQSVMFVWFFSSLIILANAGYKGISKSVYFVTIIILASLVSIKPIQSFSKKEEYKGEKRRQAKLLSAYVPRFVILYTFVVYYFITYVSFEENDIMPTLFVVYLGVDRLISMFNTVKDYMQQEYYSLFRDTVIWMRKIRKMDVFNNPQSD